HALAGKVVCEVWPDAPSGWASDLRITLRDGRVLQRDNDDFPGTPTRPLSAPQLRQKFLRCAGQFPHAQALLEQLEAISRVPDVEEAGVAGINIEDQVMPKRCGHMRGKEVVSTAEMCKKIEAAVKARRDPGFVINARTDSIALGGIEEAVARAKAYVAAGAD